MGLFTRFAAIAGTLMMAFFFVATWNFTNGIINEQLMYGIVTAFLGIIGAGRYYGLDSLIEQAPPVQHTPQLRYVLG